MENAHLPKLSLLWLTEHFTYELCNIFFSAWQAYCWCVWNLTLWITWTFILSLKHSTESSCRTDEQSECQQTVKQDYMEPSVQTLSLLGSLISHRLLVWHRPESTRNRCKPLSVFLLHTCKSSSKTKFPWHPQSRAWLETYAFLIRCTTSFYKLSGRRRRPVAHLKLCNARPSPASPQHGAVWTQ